MVLLDSTADLVPKEKTELPDPPELLAKMVFLVPQVPNLDPKVKQGLKDLPVYQVYLVRMVLTAKQVPPVKMEKMVLLAPKVCKSTPFSHLSSVS